MEGDRKSLGVIYPNLIISTHALTWRATNPVKGVNDKILISTHALTWRATWTSR